MKFSAHQFCRVVQSLKPQSLAAGVATGSTGVDCRGFEEALVILNLGTATGTIASALLQESSDDGSSDAYAAVTGGTFAAVTSSNDDTVYVARVKLQDRERYLRVLYDVDTDVVLASITFVLLHPKYGPASQVETLAFNV